MQLCASIGLNWCFYTVGWSINQFKQIWKGQQVRPSDWLPATLQQGNSHDGYKRRHVVTVSLLQETVQLGEKKDFFAWRLIFCCEYSKRGFKTWLCEIISSLESDTIKRDMKKWLMHVQWDRTWRCSQLGIWRRLEKKVQIWVVVKDSVSAWLELCTLILMWGQRSGFSINDIAFVWLYVMQIYVNLDCIGRLQVYFLDDPLSAVDAHV
jgi:hypothetical protein